MASRPHNVLGDETRPRFFPVDVTAAHPLRPPENRRGTAVRVWARSLAGMQKEVLVATTLGDEVWRLASDEGGDLNGYDEAPFPLGHMAAGMLASYTTEVRAVAHRRGVELRDLRLTLDNYYTMEGSALRSTMLGGALAPELTVECHTDAAADVLRGLVSDAVHASPVDALLRAALTSVFTLTVNGRPCGTGAMPECADGCAADPRDLFTDVEVASSPVHQPLVQLLPEADPVDDVGDDGGLTETQNRLLHVRGVCTVREDGVKEIVVQLRKPAGAAFRFLSDEPQRDGSGRAPDAASYLAAGIAFCFMTQFGRYAAIARKSLENYRLVQDLHLPQGGASGGPGTVGSADPVETHVFLETEHGEEFGQQALAMSEQTCFLHAMCRSALETRIRVLSPT